MKPSQPVVYEIERVDKNLVEAMKAYPTATIHEAYGARGAFDSSIKPIHGSMRVCGPVVTVKARPGDNLIVHKAIYVARPGDVLLVDTTSYREGGFWGGIMATAAQARGLAGLVTDGAVRDTVEMIRMNFPVFSQAVSIKGTTKTCPGSINHALQFQGVHIKPGDLIVGDADGVVVVARKDVADVLRKAKEREAKEAGITEALKAGKTTLELYGFAKLLEREGIPE